jgi:hypothetical protein
MNRITTRAANAYARRAAEGEAIRIEMASCPESRADRLLITRRWEIVERAYEARIVRRDYGAPPFDSRLP